MKRETTIRMDELNFRTILKDILKNAVFIILAVMIAVMGIRTYKNIVYVPEYTANATLAVMAKGNASNDTYSSLSTASSMAEVFSEVFQSDVMKEKIEEDLGSIPADTAIKSSLIPETNLLVLSVTAKDPQAAYRILQSILENYPDVSDYIFGNAVLEVVMDPEVPVGPSNALNTSKLEKLGILGAAGLIIALTIIFSILRDTIKTSRSAKRYLEGECLAVLPYETKNKTLKSKIKKINKAVLLNNPVIGFEYEEGCHRLASRLEFKTRTDEEKIILVTSVAENEGKSTVAINLAMALARKNKRVLLVDMDFPKPAVYKLLDQKVNKKRSLLNFLNGGIALRDVVQYDAQKRIYTILNSQSSEEIHKYLTPRCMGSFSGL